MVRSKGTLGRFARSLVFAVLFPLLLPLVSLAGEGHPGESADPQGSRGETAAVNAKKESIRRDFNTVYVDFLIGNAHPSRLFMAILEAERRLTRLPPSKWNDRFETRQGGLIQARLDVGPWLIDRARNLNLPDALPNPERKECLDAIRVIIRGLSRYGIDDLGEFDRAFRERFLKTLVHLKTIGGPLEPEDLPEASYETLVARELIKDRFSGVYTEFYMGKASFAQLYRALLDVEKALEKYPRTKWNAQFETTVMGLHYARVDLAEWFLAKQKNVAFANLEDLEAGKKALQKASDFLKPVDRSKIEKLKMGEDNYADYPKFYDDARKLIDQSFKEFDSLATFASRKPPPGKTDLLKGKKEFWKTEGALDFSLADGVLKLKASGGNARLNAMQYFLEDFTLTITFKIIKGGFDVILRARPGRGSPFFAGFNGDELPDPKAPFTLVFKVSGGKCTITDIEGRELCDPIETDRAPSGGGIGIKLRGKDAALVVRELKIEVKKPPDSK